MSQETAFFPIRGGLNLIAPAIETPPGHCIGALNYSPVQRGYRREQGYERFDGHPRPSQASYWLLRVKDVALGIEIGDVVTGGASGATGVAIIVALSSGDVVTLGVVVPGVLAGDEGTDSFVVLTAVSGTYQDGEALQVSASTFGYADGTALERAGASEGEDQVWLHLAIERARGLISAPAGSGPVRGGFILNGTPYCFRDNVGGSAGVLYKSTTAGWVAQSLGRSVAFTSGGTYQVLVGDTITGASSSAAAVITRVILASGTWAGGDAAGTLIFASQTGTFSSENLNVGAHTNVATIAGNSAAYSLPPGGRYDCVVSNFFGASNLTRAYCANGVGKGFEWDGAVFVSIDTGMGTLDKPQHVAAHKEHLFFSFAGGSLQFSAVGNPYAWSAILGAAEIGLGEDITGILGEVVGTLLILGRRKVAFLYGTSSSDFELTTLTFDSGGAEWSLQMMGTPLYLDERGIRDLSTTQRFGGFLRGEVTERIEPLMAKLLLAGRTVAGSLRVRSKNQYRLYLDDLSGFTVFIGRDPPEILPFKLLHKVTSTWSGEDSSGRELLFFGSDNGMVYQIDAGTSFDGSEVEAWLRLPFNHVGSPTQKKRWCKATLETDAQVNSSISITAEFSYADPNLVSMQAYAMLPTVEGLIFDEATWDTFRWTASDQGALEAQGAGGLWNESNWDEFYWSSPIEGVVSAHIDGFGKNISLGIFSKGIYAEPHTIHGLTLHYSLRGLDR